MKYIYENGNTQTAFDTDYNTACAMIANGEAAMMVQGLWALEPIKEINPSINLGMMALPVSDDPSETKLFQFPRLWSVHFRIDKIPGSMQAVP